MAAAVYLYAERERQLRNRYIPFYEYYARLDPSRIAVVWDDTMPELPNAPMERGGVLYLPHDLVRGYIDEYLFWEPEHGRLTITTGEKVFKFTAGSELYTVNFYHTALLHEPFISEGGIAWLPKSFIDIFYDVEISFDPNQSPKLLITGDPYATRLIGRIGADGAKLRYGPGPKEPIAADLAAHENVRVFRDNLVVGRETYIKVRAGSGITGYILNTELSEFNSFRGLERPVCEYKPPLDITGRINMTWTVSSAVTAEPVPKGLDIVSPQWFTFDLEKLDGSINSLASEAYVRWAHEHGLLVWAMIDDVTGSPNPVNAVLTVPESRERAVAELISLAGRFNLDGINIDFERVREADAPFYLQFLRELYPLMRERGLILSVDMLTPIRANMHYNRAEVAKTSDFVVVMAYDEHWSTSSVSGPNASISFARNAVVNTLREVPPEKLIMGIPFYVRVWRETEGEDGAVTVSQRALSMDRAYRQFTDNGAVFEWDGASAHYYAEYTLIEDGVEALYRVWLEDERSMEEKLKVARANDIAGVSSWRMGLEKESIWDLIYRYMKQ